jgi:phage terminase large subunit-like protein
MVELHPELASRVQVYKEKLVVPDRGATFVCLPADARALEGLDPSLALVDEAGVVDRAVYEVVALASGKRAASTVVCIGTPGPDPHVGVLVELRDYARTGPDDPTFVWREFSAAAFADHPVDCEHCWELANPALDDFLHRDAMQALLPPKTRESTFRRARLCQFVTDESGSFIPEGVWDRLSTGEDIPAGGEVVVSLDGSFNGDSTALLLTTVAPQPHMAVLGLWEAPAGDEHWRVPVAEVEDVIRASYRTWQVREIVADPFRWTRSLQALEAEGLPISEFPWSAARVTPACTDLYQAAIAGDLSHSGDADLSRHIRNAVVTEDARGVRIDKGKRNSTRHIDLAACAVMGHSRAVWLATRPQKKKRRAMGFAS